MTNKKLFFTLLYTDTDSTEYLLQVKVGTPLYGQSVRWRMDKMSDDMVLDLKLLPLHFQYIFSI